MTADKAYGIGKVYAALAHLDITAVIPPTSEYPAGAARIPDGGSARRVHITEHHVDVLRARRKRLVWGNHETNLYSRHRWLVEGVHGLAKTLHGMARAARRGLENMKIKALLTATAINLKRLAKAILLAMIQALLLAKNGQNIAA